MSRRVAIVTGAASGIGAATAMALAGDGFHVEASDIDEARLARTAERIRAGGGSVAADRMDVCSTDSVAAAVEALASRVESVDVLVNNAGFASMASLEDMDDAFWDRVVNLNLTSMMRVSRAVLPLLRSPGATIVCLGSIAGHTIGWPGRLAYASAKAGVTGLVRTLAMELAPRGVTVNGVAPAGLHASADQVPLGRVGTPEDIADVIALLASPRARFMTGQMISVDGGMCVSL